MARPGPALISGRVIDASGAPIAAARVFFVAGPDAFPDMAALTDTDGSFILSAPTPGNYAIQGAADGFHSETVTVTVAAGETVSREIVLELA